MTAPVPAPPPLVKTVRVPWDPAAAFRRFTAEIGSWWPLATHSVGGHRSAGVRFEGQSGGRIVETVRGGEPSVWGTVTAWEPDRRVAFTWHPGQGAELATEVEVRFEIEGSGAKVTLTHTGWEILGRKGKRMRGAYRLGWEYVLAIFADRPTRPLVLGSDLMTVPLVAFRRGRRLLASAAVGLLLVAAAHTAGHYAPVPPNSPAETITEEMAAIRIPMGMGMTPSVLDIFNGFSLSMSVLLVWAGLSTLAVAAHGTRRDVQRRAWSGLVFCLALALLSWDLRLPPTLLGFAAIALLFGASAVGARDRG